MHLKIALYLAALFVNISFCYGQGGRVIHEDMYKPTTSAEAKDFYNKGEEYFNNNDFRNAIRQYELAIKEDSSFIDAYDNLGLAFRKMNQLDSAEHYYLISHKKYPAGTVCIMNLGVVEEMRKNYRGAISYYDQLIAATPEDPEGYYGKCRMETMLQNYDEALKYGELAEKYYKKANSPVIGDCYYMLCIISYTMNDLTRARKYLSLTKAAGVEPDSNLEAALK